MFLIVRPPSRHSLAVHAFTLFVSVAAFAAEPRTWFVDSSVSTSGDGSAASPFATLSAAAKASAAGDVIVLAAGGRYRDGIALKDGQTLRAGEGTAAPVIFNTGGSVVKLAAGNTIEGVKISATSGAAIEGSPSGKTTIRKTTIEAEGAAAAVALTSAAGEITFDADSSIAVLKGTVDAITITGSPASITVAGPLDIATNGARALFVRDAGRIAITGAGSKLQTTGAAAIEISKANLDVALDSVSVAGARSASKAIALRETTGRFAVNGGTIKDTLNRAIELVSAEGVSLANLVLEKNALRNGVSGTACGGDLVAAETLPCNAVVFLHGTRGVKLAHVLIDGSNQVGINGEGITDLELEDVRILGAGDESFENAIQLRNATGVIDLEGCRIERAAARGLYLQNGTGSATLKIAKSVFTNGAATNGQQGLLVGAHKDATVAIDIRDSEFSAMIADGVQVSAAGTSKVTVAIASSRFDRVAGAVNLTASDRATIDYTITGNRMNHASLGAITVAALAPSSAAASGVIADNTIGTAGAAGSGGRCGGCHGIAVTAGGSSRVAANITGNTIQQVDGPGIRVIAGGTSTVSAAVTANTIREPVAGNDQGAIRLQSGTGKADTAKLCVTLGGTGAATNRIAGIWSPEGHVLLNNRFAATKLELAGLAETAVARFVAQRNNGATAAVKLMTAQPGNAITSTGQCPVPTLR